MAAIFNSAILNLAILDSATLVFPLKLHSFTLTQLDDGSHTWILHKLDSDTLFSSSQILTQLDDWHSTVAFWLMLDSRKLQTHSFWLNLMMAVILNSAILDLDTFLSSLRFTPKHSLSSLTLTQTNSIWLTHWWWQPSWIFPSWILPSWIQPFCTKLWLKLIHNLTQKPSLIHSDSV